MGEPAGLLRDFLDPSSKTRPRAPSKIIRGPLKPLTWSDVVIKQRRNELRKLVFYRYGHNLTHTKHAIGPAIGWIVVLANLCVCLQRPVTFGAIDCLAAVIGYREKIDPVIVEAIAKDVRTAAKEWWSHELLSPDEVGHLLEVTVPEREEAGLRRIGSIEESAKERRERLRGDRRRKPKAIQKPWEVEDISRATWYRRNR